MLKTDWRGEDREWFARLCRVTDENAAVTAALSRLLSVCPRAIAPENLAAVEGCGVSAEEAYSLLLAGLLGLDDEVPAQRALRLRYLVPALRELDADAFQCDPYLAAVPFPEERQGRWALTHLRYAPCELLIRDNVARAADGTETVPLGFFRDGLTYPAVLEGGREWMTVTPNEVNSMTPAIGLISGRVAVLGLGLGYFTLRATLKPEVSRVDVYERDSHVIRLFTERLLPHFPSKEKVVIHRGDAVEAAARGFSAEFVFADLWHDAADGVPLYCQLKALEGRSPGHFLYWAEPVLLSALRFALMEDLRGHGDTPVFPALAGHTVSGRAEAELLLSDDGLRLMASGRDPLRTVEK